MKVQNLWQVLYQILQIIFLKEFIKLNVNTDTMMKNVKLVKIHTKYPNCFFEYTNFKNDLIEYKCLCCKTNHQKRLGEKLKKRFIYTYIYIYINFYTISYIQ